MVARGPARKAQAGGTRVAGGGDRLGVLAIGVESSIVVTNARNRYVGGLLTKGSLPPAVDMRGVSKTFGRLVALDGVDFDIACGEVHALLGENGAGKSTLMSVLFGLHRADEGSIAIHGTPAEIRSPQDSASLGIGMVHQHFRLVPTLTAAQNIALGLSGQRLVRPKELREIDDRIAALSEQFGLEVPRGLSVWQMSVGDRQRLEILRALYHEARILILDEPTAVLTPGEAERFVDQMRQLADAGRSIVVITHHLDEVMRGSDRITVLRQGRKVGEVSPADTSVRELAEMMVGSEAAGRVVSRECRSDRSADDVIMRVDDLRARSLGGAVGIAGVDFEVRSGEVVGIAGVEGNGQVELEGAIVGTVRVDSGAVVVGGRDVTSATPGTRMSEGLSVIPSDRYRSGVIGSWSVERNLALLTISKRPFARRGRIDHREVREQAVRLIRDFSVKAKPVTTVESLSGGHAQRVVLARCLDSNPRLLLAAQPTRGLDVGAAAFVRQALLDQADRGVGVLLISSDLDELLEVSDRVLVMYRGRIVGAWSDPGGSRAEIGQAMGGSHVAHVAP